MSISSKAKRDIDRERGYGFRASKFYSIRNKHSVKSRVDWLIDRKIKNESLLQKIRIKFGMSHA